MRYEDEDRACIDCALDEHELCLQSDASPVGERACCCGAIDEVVVDPWAVA